MSIAFGSTESDAVVTDHEPFGVHILHGAGRTHRRKVSNVGSAPGRIGHGDSGVSGSGIAIGQDLDLSRGAGIEVARPVGAGSEHRGGIGQAHVAVGRK